jgi:hypothetical protein
MFGADLWMVKLRSKLPKIVADAHSYTSGKVRSECIQLRSESIQVCEHASKVCEHAGKVCEHAEVRSERACRGKE